MSKRKLYPTLKGKMLPAMSRMPEEVLDHIDTRADQQFRSRSDIIRSLVLAQLRHEGVVAAMGEEATVVAE